MGVHCCRAGGPASSLRISLRNWGGRLCLVCLGGWGSLLARAGAGFSPTPSWVGCSPSMGVLSWSPEGTHCSDFASWPSPACCMFRWVTRNMKAWRGGPLGHLLQKKAIHSLTALNAAPGTEQLQYSGCVCPPSTPATATSEPWVPS